jgi:hypothetical protein
VASVGFYRLFRLFDMCPGRGDADGLRLFAVPDVRRHAGRRPADDG